MNPSFRLVLSCIGAAYGTAQAGLGLCRAGTRDPNMIIKGIIPVAMAGVRGIYGLVLAIIIMSGIHPDKDYTQYNGFMHLGAGLCCGAAQFASGIAVGVVGESGTQAVVRQMKLFAPVVLILIFTEVRLFSASLLHTFSRSFSILSLYLPTHVFF